MEAKCHCGGKFYKVFGIYEIWDIKVPFTAYQCVECGEQTLTARRKSELDSNIMFALNDLVQKMKCCTNCKYSPYHSYCHHPDNPIRIDYKCNLWELK